MSRYVKDLLTREIRRRLEGVQDALLVNVVGIDVNRSTQLRQNLRSQGIELLVIRNSLARRATEGSPLAAAFGQAEGNLAVCWGGADIVALAKEVDRLVSEGQFAPFAARGGVLDGQRLTAEDVHQISRWPTRAEQLSILAGQILAPAARLSAQFTAPAARLASQVKKCSDETASEPVEETATE
jgi:ribosomal protein L10